MSDSIQLPSFTIKNDEATEALDQAAKEFEATLKSEEEAKIHKGIVEASLKVENVIKQNIEREVQENKLINNATKEFVQEVAAKDKSEQLSQIEAILKGTSIDSQQLKKALAKINEVL